MKSSFVCEGPWTKKKEAVKHFRFENQSTQLSFFFSFFLRIEGFVSHNHSQDEYAQVNKFKAWIEQAPPC